MLAGSPGWSVYRNEKLQSSEVDRDFLPCIAGEHRLRGSFSFGHRFLHDERSVPFGAGRRFVGCGDSYAS